MKRKRMHRILGLILLAAMMLSIAVPVYAEKIHFDITIGNGGYDPKSKRADKADGEQKYYVRSYYFSRDAYYNARSMRLSDGKGANNIVYIASDSEMTQWADNASYGWYAQPGVYYYLRGWTDGVKLQTKGYYNP